MKDGIASNGNNRRAFTRVTRNLVARDDSAERLLRSFLKSMEKSVNKTTQQSMSNTNLNDLRETARLEASVNLNSSGEQVNDRLTAVDETQRDLSPIRRSPIWAIFLKQSNENNAIFRLFRRRRRRRGDGFSVKVAGHRARGIHRPL